MTRSFRSLGLGAALALVIAGGIGTLPQTAQAINPTSTAAINVEADAVILHGYDPVAYFTMGKPTKGNAKYRTTYRGAVYHFASQANRAKFLADPVHYAPQFGGFCAMGVALGKKLDVDPTVFKVVDGRLYLNVNADVFKKWSEDVPGNIARAEANWPAIKDKAPSAL
jgi:YHS domain-containing protein